MRIKRPVSAKETDFLCQHGPEGFHRPPTKVGKCSQALGITLFLMILIASSVYAGTLTASWYSYESCIKEGTSGIMANGEVMKNENLTCAAWGYRFGTVLLVTNLSNGRTVEVKVTDRGPSKRLVKKGRVVDLSKAAFNKIAPLGEGVIKVSIKVVK